MLRLTARVVGEAKMVNSNFPLLSVARLILLAMNAVFRIRAILSFILTHSPPFTPLYIHALLYLCVTAISDAGAWQ